MSYGLDEELICMHFHRMTRFCKRKQREDGLPARRGERHVCQLAYYLQLLTEAWPVFVRPEILKVDDGCISRHRLEENYCPLCLQWRK